MVKHAQISARIYKYLLSVSSLRKSPAELMLAMADLSAQLEGWRDTLPFSITLNGTSIQSGSELGRERDYIIYLHFAYFGSLTAIHTKFFYPWISGICGIDTRDPAQSQQIGSSTAIVADTARSIIRTTRAMNVDASSPQWYTAPAARKMLLLTAAHVGWCFIIQWSAS